ncbi:MAG TPA: urea carboxylase-associated family protein [Solirubrobacteraceae bacterium]|nr:urea carboxylase-associated family protein [Solirubrobacteraceae bacterium]
MATSLTAIPARTGWSGRLRAGQSFQVIDVQGGQCADLWAFAAEDPNEALSAQHTRVHMAGIYPAVGWTFLTARRRPILRFTGDTSPGRHDCLVAACDSARYEQLGAASGHASCEENLRAEAAKQGIPMTFAPQPINVFANFRVDVHDGGRLELEECVTSAGDAATFELLMDAVVVLSACPQDIIAFQPGGPSDMAVEVVG